jgi:hypothetical protein
VLMMKEMSDALVRSGTWRIALAVVVHQKVLSHASPLPALLENVRKVLQRLVDIMLTDAVMLLVVLIVQKRLLVIVQMLPKRAAAVFKTRFKCLMLTTAALHTIVFAIRINASSLIGNVHLVMLRNLITWSMIAAQFISVSRTSQQLPLQKL